MNEPTESNKPPVYFGNQRDLGGTPWIPTSWLSNSEHCTSRKPGVSHGQSWILHGR